MAPSDHHRRQFDAYCNTIFDHRAHLDAVEMRYLEHVFAAARPAGADHLPISWKTYGHKIAGGRVQAFQLGLGFQALGSADMDAIEAVLENWLGSSALSEYRGLLGRSQGAGLGWVFPTDERRFYCFFDEPNPTRDARHRPDLAELCLPEFILGWTFQGSGLIESKTYYFPLRTHWTRLLKEYLSDAERGEALAANAVRLALVVSREDAPRLQFDVAERCQSAMLRTLGNVAAIGLSRRCAEIVPPLQLDTVAVTARGLGVYFD